MGSKPEYDCNGLHEHDEYEPFQNGLSCGSACCRASFAELAAFYE